MVTVDTLRPPVTTAPGLVAVHVPTEIVEKGTGFSFALPDSITQAAAGSALVVTLGNGQSLPAGVQYNAANESVDVAATYSGGFPFQIIVNMDLKKSLLVISVSNAANRKK